MQTFGSQYNIYYIIFRKCIGLLTQKRNFTAQDQDTSKTPQQVNKQWQKLTKHKKIKHKQLKEKEAYYAHGKHDK